jgi:hypothetical protein
VFIDNMKQHEQLQSPANPLGHARAWPGNQPCTGRVDR